MEDRQLTSASLRDAYPLGTQVHRNMDISYNDISESLMLSSDGGQSFTAAFILMLPGFAFIIIGSMIQKQRVTPTAAHVVGLCCWNLLGSGLRTCQRLTITFYGIIINVIFTYNKTGCLNAMRVNRGLYNNTFATDAGDSVSYWHQFLFNRNYGCRGCDEK